MMADKMEKRSVCIIEVFINLPFVFRFRYFIIFVKYYS